MAMGYDRYTPEGKRLMREIEELKKLQVRTGYQDDGSTEEDGTSLLDIALWNELGTENAPSRPFLRKTFDDNEAKIRAFAAQQIKRLVAGATAKDVLQAIGVFLKGLVQETITDGDFEANAPSTIKKKGSDKPLIDTGHLRQSVNSVIAEKGGE